MLRQIIVLAFLLGLLVGCGVPPEDPFLIDNDYTGKIVAVHGQRHGYVAIVQGVKTGERISIPGEFENYSPMPGDVIKLKNYNAYRSVYRNVAIEGKVK